jgi:hypothetical protein
MGKYAALLWYIANAQPRNLMRPEACNFLLLKSY